MSRQDDALATLELSQLVHAGLTQTAAIAAQIASAVLNDVLECELAAIGAEGYAVMGYHTAVGSVALANHGTGTMTVQGGAPAGGSAPGRGPGLGRVDAGSAATLNVTGTVITIYGTPGDVFTFQAFTGGQPPAWGWAV